MESMVPEFDYYKFIRERSGSSLPGIVPSNTYACKDGKYIVIGGNNDSIFKRLMKAIGRDEVGKILILPQMNYVQNKRIFRWYYYRVDVKHQ